MAELGYRVVVLVLIVMVGGWVSGPEEMNTGMFRLMISFAFGLGIFCAILRSVEGWE